MTAMSDYLETKVLQWLKGTAMPPAPVAAYVGLFNGDPLDAGTGGAEVTTTIRAAGRVAATFGPISDVGGASKMSNSAVVDYGAAAGAADISHFGLFDAAAGGNLLMRGTILNGQKTAAVGTSVSFPVGTLVLGLD
ncbi:hypothetical protein SAMN06295912_102251 [Sphingomonas laterariae]|uniref:Uncharacterized protein n=1 Tax=Edaphosphingomonas laterariae TaxID=861865 RepID=A0A239CM03_9SPHN|nr:hypothetical protein [Sphingomonas laterariae]SNS20383.1 hypothetical protein SAMN06295912_102251 [Sphingomonas laterariae]